MNTETEKLYETDSMLRSFTALVTGCQPAGKGFAVTLDRTAFYPEGGGQPADRGVLCAAGCPPVQVRGVQLQGGRILHFTLAPLCPGAKVTGRLDWARRFDLMQQHTADHLFSALVRRHFGGENVGFHIGETLTHMDFSCPLDPGQIDRLEQEANDAITENLAVTASWPAGDALRQMDLRSKKELDTLDGPVRVVTIAGLDACACCGTHLPATGGLGLLKITGCESYKGGTRVFLAAGRRAFLLCQQEHRQVEALSGLFSVPQTQVVPAGARLQQELAKARFENGRLQDRWLEAQAAAFAGRSHPLCFLPEAEADLLRRFALLLCRQGAQRAAVFGGQDGAYRYALAAGPGTDLRPLGKALNEQLAGRGGGKPELLQGSCAASRGQIEAFFSA